MGFNAIDIWHLDMTGSALCSSTVQIALDQESGDFEPFFLLQKQKACDFIIFPAH